MERHARGEAELGDIIRGNFPGGFRFREAWIARALIELVDDLTEAELRANVHPKELSAGGKDGMTAFLLDLPTYATNWEMRFLLHRERRGRGAATTFATSSRWRRRSSTATWS